MKNLFIIVIFTISFNSYSQNTIILELHFPPIKIHDEFLLTNDKSKLRELLTIPENDTIAYFRIYPDRYYKLNYIFHVDYNKKIIKQIHVSTKDIILKTNYTVSIKYNKEIDYNLRTDTIFTGLIYYDKSLDIFKKRSK